jgi:site-specific DNA recombinase
MRQNSPVKYLLYARKSSESEDRQVASIDSQIEHMQRDAQREGLEIANVLSEARSAKSPGRPVFGEVLQRIRRGEAQGILCWKLDRLARNPVDGGQISWMLQQGLIRHVRTHDRDYYPSDNVLMMSVEFGMANQYVRDLSEGVKRGLKDKAKRGWFPGRPRIGYLTTGRQGRGERIIIKDPERFDLVRRIFDLMLTGAYTVPRVHEIATSEWVLRSRSDKKLSLSNFYAILGDPFYYGQFEFPRRSGNWYQGAHEAMITPEEFDRIQILLGRKGATRSKTHLFSFTGVMRCGHCRRAVTAEEKFKRPKNGKVHRYVYYHCTKKRNPACPEGSVEEKKLLTQILRLVDSLTIPEEFHAYALKWFRQECEKETQSLQTALQSRQQAHDVCIRKLDKLLDMRTEEAITEEEFTKKRVELLKEKARYQFIPVCSEKGELRVAEEMLTFIRYIKEKLQNSNEEQRREILLALGSNHRLSGQKLALELEKPLIPMRRAATLARRIHGRLEPRRNGLTQQDLAAIYGRIPVVSALLEEARIFLREVAGKSPFRIAENWSHADAA